jgi:hypothetical protein
MTEEEWLACTRPESMLPCLRRKASGRTLRLFAVACCRNIWAYLRDARSRRAVEVAERFADGSAGREELARAQRDARAAALETHCLGASAASDAATEGGPWGTFTSVPHDASGEVANVSVGYADDPSVDARAWEKSADQESRRQAVLARDVFGNPFRPSHIDPVWLAWHGGTVPKLAQSIYDERRFPDMPILGDALEEAGCTDPEILGHCRSGGEHVRGCWVVDLILEKH